MRSPYSSCDSPFPASPYDPPAPSEPETPRFFSPPSPSRIAALAIFNAIAIAILGAFWSVGAVQIPVPDEASPRLLLHYVRWFFAAGGLATPFVVRALGRVSSNVAIAALSFGSTLVSLALSFYLRQEPLPSVAPIYVLAGLKGAATYALLAVLYARILRDTPALYCVPFIFIFYLVGRIGGGIILHDSPTLSSAATLSAALAVLALIGPRSNDAAERAAPRPSLVSIFARQPLFWTTILVAGILNFHLYYPASTSFASLTVWNGAALNLTARHVAALNALGSLSEFFAILLSTLAVYLCGGLKRAFFFALVASTLRFILITFGFSGLVIGSLLYGCVFVGSVSIIPALYLERFYAPAERRQAQALLIFTSFVLPNVLFPAPLCAAVAQVVGPMYAPFWALVPATLAVLWVRRGATVPALGAPRVPASDVDASNDA